MNTSLANEIRMKVTSHEGSFWRPGDFDGSPAAVDKALSRLAAEGELRRMRRGLYWRGPATPIGMAPPGPWSLAKALVEPYGVGPAGLSAGLALGLSTQVPREEIIAVPLGRHRPAPGIRFVSRTASLRRDLRLTFYEVALLEVLRDWGRYVELPTSEALDLVADLLRSRSIRPSRVAQAAATEPSRVRHLLRSLLMNAGFENEATFIKSGRNVSSANASPLAV